ncbi:MAG: hypothetical protein WA741_19075 [Candidatus Sulfotelmatobacter sp.]
MTKHSFDFRNRQAGVREVLKYLGTDYEVELLVPKRQRLCRGFNIDEWSHLEIHCYVAFRPASEQWTIRLQSSSDIEHAQTESWQTVQSGFENAAAAAQD